MTREDLIENTFSRFRTAPGYAGALRALIDHIPADRRAAAWRHLAGLPADLPPAETCDERPPAGDVG